MSQSTRILDRKFVPAGTLIIKQGTMGNRAYMIESGIVDVFVTDADGNETILSQLGPGSLLGEMAAISEGQRSASARAREDSVVIAITAQELQASMRASDGMYKRLMRMMVDRMKDTNQKLIKKDQQLADIEKAARENLENVAAHLAAKQEKLEKEIPPLVERVKSAWDNIPPAPPPKGK
jgi:CRP-like cAMP-binding protein